MHFYFTKFNEISLEWLKQYNNSTINKMKHAYVFPGQGAQFVGMGKDLYDQFEIAKKLYNTANEILGFSITDEMFSGTD